MTDSVLLTEILDGVAVVTLNRPDVRNALNHELRRALPATLAELDADDATRVIVLTGADPAFCAGLDLTELASSGLTGDATEGRLPLGAVAKPLIGAINGATVTGGLELALGCDLLIASERARFADTHARVGVMPGWGLTLLLPQAIGLRRARQMSLTGNYIDAAIALEWGLVNEVVGHDRLLDRAVELGRDMASIPVDHLRAIKDAYRTTWAPHDDAALAAEAATSRSWARSFDPEGFAARRDAIETRGRQQQQ